MEYKGRGNAIFSMLLALHLDDDDDDDDGNKESEGKLRFFHCYPV